MKPCFRPTPCFASASSGPPYKPQEVRVRVRDIDSRQYYVQWKVLRNASSPSDSVNVSYTVRFRGVSHYCSIEHPDAQLYGCRQLSSHHTAAFDEFQCEVQKDPPAFNKFCDYNVSVVVHSSAGEAESDVLFVPLPVLRKYFTQ